MKASRKITAIALACVLGMAALAGCAGSSPQTAETTETPAGAAPVLPVGHEGRLADLGVNGCYGCHGSSEEADPFLTQASSLPDNHYVNEDRTTRQINEQRILCDSCHVQKKQVKE